MLRDLRYAIRLLRQSPVFTLIVILSLALGIGANTAVFTLVDQALLQTLAASAPEQLALLSVKNMELRGSSSSDNNQTVFTTDMLKQLQTGGSGAIAGIAARGTAQQAVLNEGIQENVSVELVSGNYFRLLGVKAILGRTLTEDDDRAPGDRPVVVLPWGTWQERFNADRNIVGRTIRLNGLPFTVAGVLPMQFNSVLRGERPRFIAPISMQKQISPDFDGFAKDSRWLNLIARLQPGVSRDQAATALQPTWEAILDSLAGKTRERKPDQTLTLVDGSAGINQAARTMRVPLLILMGTTGVVLLIACVNIAGLLLARAAARQREIAIRLSLGATRWRLLRQALTESFLLSLAGAAAGLILASWMTTGLLKLSGADPSESTLGWYWDWRVLAFAAVLCLVTTLLFGAAPAAQASGAALARSLHNRSLPSGQAAIRKGLVGAQVALATLLLFTAGLFARSLQNLMAVDPGFRVDQVVQFDISPRQAGYDHPRGQQLYTSLLDRLRTTPGALEAGAVWPGPMSGSTRSANLTITGYRPPAGQEAEANIHATFPGFFRTVGTPVIAGRDFLETDRAGAPKVVIVNESFARRYCEGNAVGRRMAWGAGNRIVPDMEIVGVVPDIRGNLREAASPAAYTPHAQESKLQRMTFFVRTTAEDKAAMEAARQAVRSLDANLPVDNVQTLRDRVAGSVRMDRLLAILCTAFAAVAVLLTAIGVYGVIAWTVSRRTNELAIRMALGALPSRVLLLVLGEITIVAGVGIATGAALALATGQFAESKLFGVPGRDAGMLTLAIVTSALVAFAATAIPAWRATRIQPADALRAD